MRGTCGWQLWVGLAVLVGCARTAVDTFVVPEACRELQPLAEQPNLVPWQTHYVHFSSDRSFLLLHVAGEPDRLVRVDLPSGAISTVVDRISMVTPLGGGKAFLLEGTNLNQAVTSLYDGNQVRPLFDGYCDYAATPDATALYAVGPCVGAENGLTRIDLAAGTRITIDPRAVMDPSPGIWVSPNGQWIAYGISDPEDSQRTIAVADAVGNVYSITTAQKVYLLDFASDDLMLFQTEGPPGTPGDMHGHVPGSGDTSFLLAADRSPGNDDGYAFSPDRSQVLAVQRENLNSPNAADSIYSLPLDGAHPILLVTGWRLPGSGRPSPIGFDSQGKYVVYSSDTRGDPAMFPLSVVDLQGSPPRTLSDDAGYIQAPATSSVLIVENRQNGEQSRIRLTDLATGRDRFSYSSKAGLVPVAVLRNDQAFLFTEFEGYTQRARFLSARHPQSVVLGEWNEARCRGCSELVLQSDPTECFTVVNTDDPSHPGTRLVLFPE